MSNCCAPKTPFVPEQVLKAVKQIEKRCSTCVENIDDETLQTGVFFGVTIEMSTDGNTLAIGADGYAAKDGQGVEQPGSGAVFVFKRKESFYACGSAKKKSNGRYILQQILFAIDPKTGVNQVQQGAVFGLTLSVSATGARIVVGAYGETSGEPGNFGAVYVFDQKPKSLLYKSVQKIVRDQQQSVVGNSFFGFEVGLSKDGRVLLILETPTESLTAPTQTLFYEDCGYGFSADCSHQSAQTARFVLKQTVDVAQLVQGTTVSPENVFQAGRRLKLNGTGNTALIAARKSTVVDNSENEVVCAGLVFVLQRFVKPACRNGVTKWATTQVLASEVPQENAEFGTSLAITPDGRFIAVEEPLRDKAQSPSFGMDVGLVSVFERACDTKAYTLAAELCPTGDNIQDSADTFQKSVTLSDDGCTIAVGYELTAVSEQGDAGAVVIYQRRCSSTRWKQTQVLTAFPSVEQGQTFGSGLAMSGDGNSLAVGAWIDNPNDFVYTFSSRFVAKH